MTDIIPQLDVHLDHIVHDSPDAWFPVHIIPRYVGLLDVVFKNGDEHTGFYDAFNGQNVFFSISNQLEMPFVCPWAVVRKWAYSLSAISITN